MKSLAERTRAECAGLFERELGLTWNEGWRTQLRKQHQVILDEDKKAAELGAGVRRAIASVDKFLREHHLPLNERASWESLAYRSPRVRELYRWAYGQREHPPPRKYSKQPVQSFATFMVQRFAEAMFFDQPVLPEELLKCFRQVYSDEDWGRVVAFATKGEASKDEPPHGARLRARKRASYYYTFPTDRKLAIIAILLEELPGTSEMVGKSAKLTTPARVLEIARGNMKKVRMRLFCDPATSKPIAPKEINDVLFFKPAGAIPGRVPRERFLGIPAADE